jgi:hypothetical protein
MKTAFIALLIITAALCHAQSSTQVITLNKGDEYEKQIFIRSACVLQQGKQEIEVENSSYVGKVFKVNEVTGKGLSFIVTTKKIVDTIASGGQQMIIDSDNGADAASFIQKGLLSAMEKPAMVDIDNSGIIVAVDDAVKQNNADTAFLFSGIQPGQYTAGSDLGFIARFTTVPAFTIGYAWQDSSLVNNIKTVTAYKIDAVTNTTTTISFTSIVNEEYYNTNITGVFVMDNATGIVLKRITQSATSGYAMLNGAMFTQLRRNAVIEVCYKK